MIDTNPDPIDPKQVHSRPIRHDSLSIELLDQINVIYAVIGRYVATSLEQFEIGFMRNANPVDEVARWSCITVAWITYHEQHLANVLLSDNVERRLIAALFAIAECVEDVEKLDVPANVGTNLMDCYDGVRS